jgi:hypothetical protein
MLATLSAESLPFTETQDSQYVFGIMGRFALSAIHTAAYRVLEKNPLRRAAAIGLASSLALSACGHSKPQPTMHEVGIEVRSDALHHRHDATIKQKEQEDGDTKYTVHAGDTTVTACFANQKTVIAVWSVRSGEAWRVNRQPEHPWYLRATHGNADLSHSEHSGSSEALDTIQAVNVHIESELAHRHADHNQRQPAPSPVRDNVIAC